MFRSKKMKDQDRRIKELEEKVRNLENLYNILYEESHPMTMGGPRKG